MDKIEQLRIQEETLNYIQECEDTKRKLSEALLITAEIYNKEVNSMHREANKMANNYFNKYKRSVHADLDDNAKFDDKR